MQAMPLDSAPRFAPPVLTGARRAPRTVPHCNRAFGRERMQGFKIGSLPVPLYLRLAPSRNEVEYAIE